MATESERRVLFSANRISQSLFRSIGLGVTLIIVSVAVGLGIMFLTKPSWSARSTILFPLRQTSFLNLSMQASGLAALQGSSIGGPSILKVNQEILESETMLDLVIAKAGLKPKEGQSSVQFRKEVRSNSKFVSDQATNTLAISYECPDPKLGVSVVNAYIEGLRNESRRLSVSYMEADADTLRERSRAKSIELAKASAELQAFQEKLVTQPTVVTSGSGDNATVITLPGRWLEQLRSIESEAASNQASIDALLSGLRAGAKNAASLPTDIPSLRPWRERLLQVSYALQKAQIVKGPRDPEVVRLQREVVVARQQLGDEIQKYLRSVDANIASPELANLLIKKEALAAQSATIQRFSNLAPKEASRYQEYLRKVAALTVLVQRLDAQAFSADLASTQDPNRWNVLDPARVSPEPTNRSISKTSAIYGGVGILLWILLSFIQSLRSLGSKAQSSGMN